MVSLGLVFKYNFIGFCRFLCGGWVGFLLLPRVTMLQALFLIYSALLIIYIYMYIYKIIN